MGSVGQVAVGLPDNTGDVRSGVGETVALATRGEGCPGQLAGDAVAVRDVGVPVLTCVQQLFIHRDLPPFYRLTRNYENLLQN